jgi:hypothetical protein
MRKDFEWGPWELPSPCSSSLEGELTIPLRGASGKHPRRASRLGYITAKDPEERTAAEKKTSTGREYFSPKNLAGGIQTLAG